MELVSIPIKLDGEKNMIIGQTHFIKSVEDIYEAIVGSVPGVRFGLAFSEASGPCLIRFDGTDESLAKLASEILMKIGCGHTFIVILEGAYPINVLNAIKMVPEVCGIFCATANPVELIVCKTEQGGSILGVVDGYAPKGIETENDKNNRHNFLRKIGYKR
ncbi:MAG: adenosine-specific kinase [Halobacteria archaeon]